MRGFGIYRKYGNKKIPTMHGTFDSKLELTQFETLLWLQKANKISQLQRQVRIKLGHSKVCKVHYVADFIYYDNERKAWIIHDSKGVETTEFILKRKWLCDIYAGFVLKVAFKCETKEYLPFDSANPLPECLKNVTISN